MKKKCQKHRLCTYSCQMYYSIILNTNTSQPMPQYYKWMYEEKKLMCDCCLTKLHCFSTSSKDKIENIWTTKEVKKKSYMCSIRKRKKNQEKNQEVTFTFLDPSSVSFSIFQCVYVYIWKKVKMYAAVKFIYSEKATKIWKIKNPNFFEPTKYCSIE